MLAFLLVVLGVGAVRGQYPTFQQEEEGGRFHHMTVHDYTERVYVAGVNRIYQLARDLRMEDQATMGPLDDSPKCPVTQVICLAFH